MGETKVAGSLGGHATIQRKNLYQVEVALVSIAQHDTTLTYAVLPTTRLSNARRAEVGACLQGRVSLWRALT